MRLVFSKESHAAESPERGDAPLSGFCRLDNGRGVFDIRVGLVSAVSLARLRSGGVFRETVAYFVLYM